MSIGKEIRKWKSNLREKQCEAKKLGKFPVVIEGMMWCDNTLDSNERAKLKYKLLTNTNGERMGECDNNILNH